MSLQTMIDSKLSKLNNKDQDWVIFVHDHINIIKENAIEIYIDDAIKDRYIYKFDHFLRDNFCDLNIMWIAKLINNLCDYDDFTIYQYILIPNFSHIMNLYRIYRTSINLS